MYSPLSYRTLILMQKENHKIRSTLKHITKSIPQKKYKIIDIFEDFKQRYGKKEETVVVKEQKQIYLKRSSTLLNMNSTQLSYQKDITEIRYNADIKAGQGTLVSQKWQPLPQKCQINWKLLEGIENMVENWSTQ